MIKLPKRKYKYLINLGESKLLQLENISFFTLHFIQDPDIQQTFILKEWTVLGDNSLNVSLSTSVIRLNVMFIVFILVNPLNIVFFSLVIWL